jgi:hypothetical protein
MSCQVADPSIVLECPATESGGVRCERTGEHGTDHAISNHTIMHSLAGNGYACQSFEPWSIP